MKRLKLIFSYYSRHTKAIVFISLVFFFLLFLLLLKSGRIYRLGESIQFYNTPELSSSIYYISSFDETDKESSLDLKELSSHKIVESIAYGYHTIVTDDASAGNSNSIYNLEIYSEDMIDMFQIETSGNWLSESVEADGPYLDAVICGRDLEHIPLGAKFPIFEADIGKQILVHIVGKIENDKVLPHFGYSSAETTTEDISYLVNDVPTFIVRESDYIKQNGLGSALLSYGCILKIQNDASELEKRELYQYLNDSGGYLEMSDILETSSRRYREVQRSEVVIPILLLLLSLLAFLSVFVLCFQEKSLEMRVYYLCGYGKRRAFLDYTLGMLVPIFVPCLFWTLFILKFPPMQSEKVWFYAGSLLGSTTSEPIDGHVVLFIAGYFLVCLSLALLFSYQIIRKSTTIEMYRREL